MFRCPLLACGAADFEHVLATRANRKRPATYRHFVVVALGSARDHYGRDSSSSTTRAIGEVNAVRCRLCDEIYVFIAPSSEAAFGS